MVFTISQLYLSIFLLPELIKISEWYNKLGKIVTKKKFQNYVAVAGSHCSHARPSIRLKSFGAATWVNLLQVSPET